MRGTINIGATVLADPVVVMGDPTEVDHVDDGQRQLVWQVRNRRLQVEGCIVVGTPHRFSLIVGADQGALLMKPNGAIKHSFRYNRSGLRFKAAEGQITITGVTPKGRGAQAGLQVGDRVLARDATLLPDNFGWDLTDGPGTVVELDVQRGSGRQRSACSYAN